MSLKTPIVAIAYKHPPLNNFNGLLLMRFQSRVGLHFGQFLSSLAVFEFQNFNLNFAAFGSSVDNCPNPPPFMIGDFGCRRLDVATFPSPRLDSI